jgi:Carboxypeptidase regulatory-like domain/TonB dependent receptor-like, beta-barrel
MDQVKVQKGKIRRNFKWVTAHLCVFTLLTSLAIAQRTTGALGGQVLDPQGAAVPNAKISVTDQETGVVSNTVTSSAGTWNVPSLIPGKYSVSIQAQGFRTLLRRDVMVLADHENTADTQLQMGVASEVVEVLGSAVAVDTSSSSLNNDFSSQDVQNLPNAGGALNGSPLNLAVLAPNVVAQPGGVTGVGGSVGGTRPRENNFNVDGVDDNNLAVTGPNSTVIPDAVAEFTLQTNQFSAETGHSSGGQFNLVTKTGTNSFHGSAYEYFQNRNLNAMDNLTKEAIAAGTIPGQPAYDDNRFGANLGGPIIKNKLFFFGNYEYTDVHGAGNATFLNAPTAAGLVAMQSLAADQSVNDVLKNYPVAPTADPALAISVNGNSIPVGPLVIISPLLQREHDAIANVDYSMGKHQLGFRFLLNQTQFIAPVNSTQAQFNQDNPVRNRKIAVTDTWTINDHIVNDMRLQYSYFSSALVNPCTVCSPDVTIGDLGNTTIGPSDNQNQKQNSYEVKDSVSWVIGKHTVKFGGEYTHYIYPQFFLPRSNGDYWYNSAQDLVNDSWPSTSGRTLRGAGSGSFLGTQSLFAGYVQDDLKLTPRLTLNLGLRYEYWTNPLGSETQALNAISSVPGVVTFGKPKTDINNFGPRIGFAYNPRGDGKTSLRGGFGISYGWKFQNFAAITLPPQIQSQMDPTSACSLSMPPGWCTNFGANGNGTGSPFLADGGLPSVYLAPTSQDEARALTTSYIDDTVLPKILTWSFGVQHEISRDGLWEVRYLGTRGLELPVQYRRNRISAFDAGIAPLPTFFSPSDVPAAWNVSTPTDTVFNQFNSNIWAQYGFRGDVTSDPSLGSSDYHSLSWIFTQRLWHGLSFNANYTWSHTIDDATNEFFTSLLNPRRAQDTNRIGEDRSNSDLDVRQKFALSLSYETPSIHSDSRAIKTLLDGYGFGAVYLAQTGQPVTLQAGSWDANGNGDTAGDRGVLNPSASGQKGSDVIPICEGAGGMTFQGTNGPPAVGGTFAVTTLGGGGACYDPNDLSGNNILPAIGYLAADPTAKYIVAGPDVKATIGRNSFRSPGFGVMNLSVGKKLKLTESAQLVLKADFYNVLNHKNFTVSNANVFSTAGVTAATSNPGYVQIADSNFLNSKIFSGGNRQVTLTAKFVF